MSLETVGLLLEQYKNKEIPLEELIKRMKSLPGAVLIEEDKQYVVSGKLLKELLDAIKDLFLEERCC